MRPSSSSLQLQEGGGDDEEEDSMWKAFDETIKMSGKRDEHEDDEYDGGSIISSNTKDGGCPHCFSTRIESRDGNYECVDCNTIVTRLIDSSPEWRYYGSEDNRASNPTRCGPPSCALMPGLGSSVQSSSCRLWGNNGAGGASHGVCKALQKLHMWNAMTHRERALYRVFDIISVVSNNHGISMCIVEEAKSLYKRISESRITRGENRRAIIACSVYVACKSNGVPRSVKEIAIMFDVNKCAMTKACKAFQDLLRQNMSSSTPEDFVARFCSKLGLGPDALSLCRYVIRAADDKCIVTDSTPPSLVASVIMLCCILMGIDVSRARIAEECQLSQVTIAKCYKKLVPHVVVLVPPVYAEHARNMLASTAVTSRRTARDGKKKLKDS